MSGFLLIIISSLLYPFVDVLKKKATSHYTVNIIFWAVAVFSLPIYIIFLCRSGIPAIDPSFWWIISIDAPLLIFTNILLIKDEKIAPISTTLPLLSFTPVFLIGTSYLFLGELPTTFGIMGIFLVVAGAILLKGEEIRKGLWYRIKNIFSHKASLYILIIALIWSFNANFAKMAMQRSSVEFYLFIIVLIETVFMSIWMGYRYRHHYKKMISGHLPLLIAAALITAIANIIFLFGLETVFVSYAIAIKRGILIIGSLILGAVYFKEKNMKFRIIGTTIMVIGLVFILVLK
ncbi:MAG: EamA family transporter [bacterium]|nr:EamA family transporter [bacterium]